MSNRLSPEERSQLARMAAHHKHALYDPREATEKARVAFKDSFLSKVPDPDGTLTDAERARRAEHLRTAYYVKLAYKSAQSRRARKGGGNAA